MNNIEREILLLLLLLLLPLPFALVVLNDDEMLRVLGASAYIVVDSFDDEVFLHEWRQRVL